MASKLYVLKKNGEELEKVRGLIKAKNAADIAGAEVFDGDKCVYRGNVISNDNDVESGETAGETVAVAADTDEAGDASDEAGNDADTGMVEPADEPDTADDKDAVKAEQLVAEQDQPSPQTAHYRLKALMNVREQPTRNSRIIGTQAEGVLVNVAAIENGWMRLGDGTFILYEDGKFAEKA